MIGRAFSVCLIHLNKNENLSAQMSVPLTGWIFDTGLGACTKPLILCIEPEGPQNSECSAMQMANQFHVLLGPDCPLALHASFCCFIRPPFNSDE